MERSIPLAIGDLDLTYRVTYTVLPVIPASSTGPSEGGWQLVDVEPVSVERNGEALSLATVTAIRDTLVEIFWGHHTLSDVRRLCAEGREPRA